MGLFSSKKVTYVGTTVSRVITDDCIPNSIRTGVLKSDFSGESQMIEHVMDELVFGIGMKAERMYEYGKRSYEYGLPSSTVHSSVSGKAAVQTAIESIVHGSITLDYYHFGALNNLHVGWMTLVSSHGYVQSTNQLGVLSASKGVPVFLKDMIVVVSDATIAELFSGALDAWGMPPSAGATEPTDPYQLASIGLLKTHSPFEVSSSASDHLRVEYAWKITESVLVEGVQVQRDKEMTDSFIIPMPTMDEGADYFQAKYTYDTNKVGYWLYKNGSGTYPLVDAVYKTNYSDLGSFFPFGYFRYEKKSMADLPNSNGYKTSKKLMKYLGLNYKDMIDAIHENPNIKDVEQAMLTMAVPAVTTNELEQRYLFDFFDGLYLTTRDSINTEFATFAGLAIQGALGGDVPMHSMVIQDKRFKMALNFRSITKKTKSGVLGKIGFHTSQYRVENSTVSGIDADSGIPYDWVTEIPCYVYRKQKTETLYEEIQVLGLQTVYYVFGNYTAIGDEKDPILLVPIDRGITQDYSIPDREVLYSRSLHYVFNSRVVVTVKWYQQGWFKAVLIIVMIIITILSWGSTASGLAAAITAGTLTVASLISMVIMGLIKYLIVMIAMRLFVKLVGPKFAILAAIVAMVVALYSGNGAEAAKNAPWAKDLLMASTSLISATNKAVLDQMNDLMQEVQTFEQYTKEQNNLLEKANKLLEHSTVLSPLILLDETPSDYYQRTIHSGNIGTLGLDVIGSYVDIALRLPTLTETAGDTLYG